jgi:type III secretion system FlhB-like substrate exporter
MVMRKNGGQKAIALLYDSSLPAPLVLARARGRGAERMANLAKQAGVPVVTDEGLAEGLIPLDVGALVPMEYWELVARVFVFIRKVDHEKEVRR